MRERVRPVIQSVLVLAIQLTDRLLQFQKDQVLLHAYGKKRLHLARDQVLATDVVAQGDRPELPVPGRADRPGN